MSEAGRLAQLARAPARQAGGHWFEPSIAHHGLEETTGLSRVKVRLPDGSVRESTRPGKMSAIARELGVTDAVAAKLDGEVVELSAPAKAN